MTYQTDKPIKEMRLNQSAREADGLVALLNEGELTVDAPYQRGPVWSQEQRILLIKSLLAGTPIPAIIINRREGADLNEPFYAVIDGKQRILTMAAWFDGDLAVPASWFASEYIASTVVTADGPYVTADGLTEVGARIFKRHAQLSVSESRVGTVQEEAEIYCRVNGSGTPQTPADMDNAAVVRDS